MLCWLSHPPRLVTHNIGEFSSFSPSFKTGVASEKLPNPGSHRKPGCYFYLAPQEETFSSVAPHKQFISSWPSPKKEQSNISSLGGHFYIAPYEHFISGWKGATDQNWPCEAPEATFWRQLWKWPFVDKVCTICIKKTYSSPNVESWPCGAPESAF